MTTTNEITLKRIKDSDRRPFGSDEHDYETPDGRFHVYRPSERAGSWTVIDTKRWSWQYSYRGNEILVHQAEHPCYSLTEAKQAIGRILDHGDELLLREFMTEDEAREAGHSHRIEQRRARHERAAQLERERRAAVALLDNGPAMLAELEHWQKFFHENEMTDADYHDADGTGWISRLDKVIARARGEA